MEERQWTAVDEVDGEGRGPSTVAGVRSSDPQTEANTARSGSSPVSERHVHREIQFISSCTACRQIRSPPSEISDRIPPRQPFSTVTPIETRLTLSRYSKKTVAVR